jgi:hypothetical protein
MAYEKLTVDTDGTRTKVVLAMPLPYAPIPIWVAASDILGIVILLWVIISAMIRWICKIKPPPRAVFWITSRSFQMMLVEPATGQMTKFQCDRGEIIELKKNRYDHGLWIHVQGRLMETYLQDIDEITIVKLSAVLTSLIRQNEAAIPIVSGQSSPSRITSG